MASLLLEQRMMTSAETMVPARARAARAGRDTCELKRSGSCGVVRPSPKKENVDL